MSIAMTIVIAPSRCLRCLLAGFGAILLAAAGAVGLRLSPAFAAGPIVAATLLFAAACVLHAARRGATVHRIDLSGPGRPSLTVQQGVRHGTAESLPARLLPGSTLWPRMMLLRLETGGAQERGAGCLALAVLPDSVAPEAFRALAVTLGRAGGAGGTSSTAVKIA